MSLIRLIDGRDIHLSHLYQRHTYAGVLAGLPTHEKNNQRCQDAIEEARGDVRLTGNAPVTLIPPKIEFCGPLNPKSVAPLQRLTGSNVTSPLYYPKMPPIICFGSFSSDVIKSRPDDFGSHLCIIWYQADFAMPIDPAVKREIQALAWEELAAGYEI